MLGSSISHNPNASHTKYIEIYQQVSLRLLLKQLKLLQPYNSLHLRPDKRKYYAASTEQHASGTICRPMQQPQ